MNGASQAKVKENLLEVVTHADTYSHSVAVL